MSLHRAIGAYDDEATGLRGVKRLALTDEDAEARRLVVGWLEGAGLSVRVDRVGTSTPPALARIRRCPAS